MPAIRPGSASRLRTLAVTLAVLVGASSMAHASEPFPGGAIETDGLRALSPADRLNYTTAFDALRRGDLDAARASARQAQDRVLLGQVEFERLFHADYTATYEELAAWLEDYSDLPCAPRVYNLALRRRPDGAAEPRRPAGLSGRTWSRVAAAGGGADPNDPSKTARIALNNDDLAGAYQAGIDIGDWWTAGLAAWRLNEFSDSFRAFERVANDPTEDPWVRAGAGLWAARAAGRSGRQDRIVEFLELAARWPVTFYGQIALRQLGREPEIVNQGPVPYDARFQTASLNVDEPAIDARELEAFVRSDPRARRTLAYYEVGRRTEARDELVAGVRTAMTDSARRMWNGLARVIGPRVLGSTTDLTRIDASQFPMPEIAPDGGYTIERALVYAIARKETNFNASARSAVGAYGLMQVMPTTAAELSGDRGFVTTPERLLQPAVNARLGQAYVNKVLALPAINGDLLRAAASYNAGPGPMVNAVRKLGQDADPLLLIETIDVPQARDYVEKVVAAYWIYQRLMGGALHTLDAVAFGATAVPLSLDYRPPAQPGPVVIAEVRPVAG